MTRREHFSQRVFMFLALIGGGQTFKWIVDTISHDTFPTTFHEELLIILTKTIVVLICSCLIILGLVGFVSIEEELGDLRAKIELFHRYLESLEKEKKEK